MDYETQVKNIVDHLGGYREKEVMSKPHFIEEETWNDEHKVLLVRTIARESDGYRRGFGVDLVTGKICY